MKKIERTHAVGSCIDKNASDYVTIFSDATGLPLYHLYKGKLKPEIEQEQPQETEIENKLQLKLF